MNDLSNAGPRFYSLTPIPSPALFILVALFFTGLAFSVFILVVIHNALFFVSHLLLSAMVVAFLLWNTLSSRSNRAILFFLHSFPNSDLRFARHGQLVKISGVSHAVPSFFLVSRVSLLDSFSVSVNGLRFLHVKM